MFLIVLYISCHTQPLIWEPHTRGGIANDIAISLIIWNLNCVMSEMKLTTSIHSSPCLLHGPLSWQTISAHPTNHSSCRKALWSGSYKALPFHPLSSWHLFSGHASSISTLEQPQPPMASVLSHTGKTILHLHCTELSSHPLCFSQNVTSSVKLSLITSPCWSDPSCMAFLGWLPLIIFFTCGRKKLNLYATPTFIAAILTIA